LAYLGEMLKSQAKTNHQRNYKRRRRAGQMAAKPPREPRPIRMTPPTKRVAQIKRWGRLLKVNSTKLRSAGREIIRGLNLDSDLGMAEACRRYKEHLDQRRAAKEAKAKRKAETKLAPPRYSSIYVEPPSDDYWVMVKPK
jgi:hypothetical protein